MACDALFLNICTIRMYVLFNLFENKKVDPCTVPIWLNSYWFITDIFRILTSPDSKVLGANMGPNWVLSAPDGPHVGPMNFAIWGSILTTQ